MKAKLYIILAALITCFTNCSKELKLNLIPISPKYEFQDTLYISKVNNGYLLPTQYASDTTYVLAEDLISISGEIMNKKGEEVTLTKIETKHDTMIEFKDGGIYITSKRPLKVCQINISYSENAIFNKTLKWFSDRSNKSLDFLKMEGNLYIYYSPYEKWEKGGYDKFESMTIMYRPELNVSSKHYIDENEIYFNKKDFELHFPQFKAYLLQQ